MALLKACLIVSVLAVFALLDVQSAVHYLNKSTRANLILGANEPGNFLLFRYVAARNGTMNQVQSQDVPYRGFNVNITYITAIENGTSQFATPTLISGGLRQSNATIRVTSAVSRGYNYTIAIYGKNL